MDPSYSSLLVQILIVLLRPRSSFPSPLIGESVKPAENMEFPFIVSIGHAFGYSYNDEHFCTGTLISKKHILTAAHCLEGETYRQIEVTIGFNDRINGAKYYLSDMITFSEWALKTYCISTREKEYDVAILTMKQDQWDKRITPAIISDIEDFKYYGKPVTTAGWGLYQKETGEIETPRFLQKVDMTMIDRLECMKYVQALTESKKIMYRTHLCAISDPRAIAGSGDSGAPLIHEKNVIVGVLSGNCPAELKVNDTCAQTTFVSVEYVKDFINAIISEE